MREIGAIWGLDKNSSRDGRTPARAGGAPDGVRVLRIADRDPQDDIVMETSDDGFGFRMASWVSSRNEKLRVGNDGSRSAIIA